MISDKYCHTHIYEPTFAVTGELQQLQENGSQDGKYAEYVAGERTHDKEPERCDCTARQAASRWDITAINQLLT